MCLPVNPYKIEREWKAFGLSCAVVLAREASHRCGYVRERAAAAIVRGGMDDPGTKERLSAAIEKVLPHKV
jgi:hypothetical protein